MLKIIFCLRRRPGLSIEQFQRYWREDHAELMRRHAAALRIRRYVQSHTSNDPRVAAAFAGRGSEIEPFDGVTEIWWDSIDDVIEAVSTADGRAASDALREDERNFIDLAQSPIFYASENIVVT